MTATNEPGFSDPTGTAATRRAIGPFSPAALDRRGGVPCSASTTHDIGISEAMLGTFDEALEKAGNLAE